MVGMVAFLPSPDARATTDATRALLEEAFRPGALATYARPETRPAESSTDSTRPDQGVGVWRPRLLGAHPHESRILADSADRAAWLDARAGGVTATDAAKLATPNSVHQVVRDKLSPAPFGGNAYTDHGREREPVIAAWVRERHGIAPSSLLFHAERSRRHLATPDGLHCDDDGRVLLAEIKTTGKPWNRIPRSYLRQVWWQQYVLGAERTLFVWEEHRDFVVQHAEPRFVWIERDDAEIAKLVAFAEQVLQRIDELQREHAPGL